MNGLDLFSGIGGISEALSPWVKTIAYCEVEPKSRTILLSRMYRGEVDRAPIWDDVFTLSGRHIDVPIDIISGGFPCTDISLAGLRKGLASDRSGLFWEVVRLTKEIRPKYVFLENVWPGVRKFVPTIRDQFEGLGYSCRDGFLAASDVGAPHRRQRWFMLAHANKAGLRKQSGRRKEIGESKVLPIGSLEDGSIADPNEARLEGSKRTKPHKPFDLQLLEGDSWNGYAEFFHRMDHGVPLRRYARGALGDSVVPIQAREAFRRLLGIEGHG